jgi:hypothetical protein
VLIPYSPWPTFKALALFCLSFREGRFHSSSLLEGRFFISGFYPLAAYLVCQGPAEGHTLNVLYLAVHLDKAHLTCKGTLPCWKRAFVLISACCLPQEGRTKTFLFFKSVSSSLLREHFKVLHNFLPLTSLPQ